MTRRDSLPIQETKLKVEKQETVNKKIEKPRSAHHKKAKLAPQDG